MVIVCGRRALWPLWLWPSWSLFVAVIVKPPAGLVSVGPRLVHTIPGDDYDYISDMALLDNELYILRQRRENQIDVHCTNDFTLLRRLSIEGATDSNHPYSYLHYMAACSQKCCIYVCSFNQYGIHRLGLDGSEIKWPLMVKPSYVSVTRSTNLLVKYNCHGARFEKFLLLSSEDGACLRIFSPRVGDGFLLYDCLELSEDRYVISTFLDVDDITGAGRVTHIDGDGRFLRSTNIRLDCPSYLAKDSDKFVFVSDGALAKVVVLDPSLGFVCNLTDGLGFETIGGNLVYDELLRRLYVSHGEPSQNSVLVIQL